ncbi:MAG: hypothetical protein HC849_32560 [Oscillatoriales cyanobacterium RU_3_3]|nr:hypothetical protein [Microcoleus sp. SU_5_6]NJM63815.1 hypothetical protein [Oscillatoriales cyanobacterium RU_3_3]
MVQSPAPSNLAACLTTIVRHELVGEDKHGKVRSGRAVLAIFEFLASSEGHPLLLATTFCLSATDF